MALASTTERAPHLDIDPFSVAFLSDPYPDHARMRDAGPVVHLTRYGIFAMARHAEVFAALNDWRTYSSARGVGLQDFAKESSVAAQEHRARSRSAAPRPHAARFAAGDVAGGHAAIAGRFHGEGGHAGCRAPGEGRDRGGERFGRGIPACRVSRCRRARSRRVASISSPTRPWCSTRSVLATRSSNPRHGPQSRSSRGYMRSAPVGHAPMWGSPPTSGPRTTPAS